MDEHPATSLRTPFTDLVGCAVPVQLAPMGGGVATVDLAAAVCRAGAFGMLNSRGSTPLDGRLDQMEEVGVGPYGVCFTVHGHGDVPDAGEVERVASRVRLVEFFWSDPEPQWVTWAKASGSLVGWQVGSLDEALRAVEAGCDVIAVQGVEAGGHVRGGMALLPLLCEVVEAVDVPVLAAGGITSARAMAAVLAAGASGVRVGTRFLATQESGAHPDYVDALLTAGGDQTVLTDAFSVGWPDAPHRVLRSAEEAAHRGTSKTVGTIGEEPIPRFSAQTPNRSAGGEVSAMALYAGQGVGAVRQVLTAEQVVRGMVGGARDLLDAWTGS